ncbi:hypothetical protein DFH06DRAFT_106421 [Mycena polygramma]|nr:hypothetical protein DFH06DRAFT_106421 [Mycena polygramma]
MDRPWIEHQTLPVDATSSWNIDRLPGSSSRSSGRLLRATYWRCSPPPSSGTTATRLLVRSPDCARRRSSLGQTCSMPPAVVNAHRSQTSGRSAWSEVDREDEKSARPSRADGRKGKGDDRGLMAFSTDKARNSQPLPRSSILRTRALTSSFARCASQITHRDENASPSLRRRKTQAFPPAPAAPHRRVLVHIRRPSRVLGVTSSAVNNSQRSTNSGWWSYRSSRSCIEGAGVASLI